MRLKRFIDISLSFVFRTRIPLHLLKKQVELYAVRNIFLGIIAGTAVMISHDVSAKL